MDMILGLFLSCVLGKQCIPVDMKRNHCSLKKQIRKCAFKS